MWKQCKQARAEMELVLSVALKAGTDADQFSRDIRSYLNEPNKLFRRVRDEFGNLVLSKRAAAYHPGCGVYRSSYKNARRLAVTEINMAYRKADNERWKRLDFVIGVHIEVSREHPTYDMCDELAGDYPKDFVFVGWHPHCRCIATPILQNLQDFQDGENPNTDLFKVREVPENFNKWVQGNKYRIANAKAGNATLPYFLRDNKAAMEKALGREVKGFSPNEWTPHNKLTEQQQLLNIHKGRKEFFWLKQKTWEKHVFFEESGGYVAIHKQRIAASKVSNAERAKFEKELRMCENYARAGFRIKMLEEKSGISSPDVLCNDTPAELKSVTSKQIENKAKKAFRKQGAKLVLFEIEEEDDKAHSNLYKLQHRYYYSVMYYFKSTPEKVIAQLVEE